MSTALVSLYLTAAEEPSELLQPIQLDVNNPRAERVPLAIILAAIEDQLKEWVPPDEQMPLKAELQQRIDEGNVIADDWYLYFTLSEMPAFMESLSNSAWETAMSVVQAMIRDGASERTIEKMAEEGEDWLRSLQRSDR